MTELRWNPLLSEWVIVADERQNRPVLPQDSCPLCPGVLEIPEGDYYIVSFENRFPALNRDPSSPNVSDGDLYKVRKNKGICEVILYTKEHDRQPADLSVERLRDLVDVWVDRTENLSRLDYVEYVYIFENRGEEIGVSLTHPHGQLYAFPFVPPVIARELESAKNYYRQRDRCLLCSIMEKELEYDKRIVFQNEHFLAYVPFFARFPYELHLSPRAHVQHLPQLSSSARRQLAHDIKAVLASYVNLFPQEEFPYMMVFHQAPCDGKSYDHFHFHLEFYSLKRGKEKIKYRAGVETGAGTFISSLAPEKMASDLVKSLGKTKNGD